METADTRERNGMKIVNRFDADGILSNHSSSWFFQSHARDLTPHDRV
jgi:hypothetical protein